MKLKPSLFALALAAFPAAAVDQTVLNTIGPGAAVVAGFDFDRVKASPLGQNALAQLNVAEEDFRKMSDLLGFDLRRDLREVVLISPDAAMRSNALVIVRGTFDQAKLTGVAGLKGGANLTAYNGVTMLGKGTGANSQWAAFLAGGLVFGADTAVKAAVDRSVKGVVADAGLAARVQAASAQHDAWVLTTVSPARFAPQVKKRPVPGDPAGNSMDALLQGTVVQGIENVALGLNFGATVTLSGEASMRSDKDAAALGDIMKFLGQMAGSNIRGEGNALVTLLNSLQTDAAGRTLRFSMSAPQAEFEKLMRQAAPHARPVVYKH